MRIGEELEQRGKAEISFSPGWAKQRLDGNECDSGSIGETWSLSHARAEGKLPHSPLSPIGGLTWAHSGPPWPYRASSPVQRPRTNTSVAGASTPIALVLTQTVSTLNPSTLEPSLRLERQVAKTGAHCDIAIWSSWWQLGTERRGRGRVFVGE
ncbi:hypothetical protein GQ53DRAFT_208530 [Thozetella sp. PMI_491]|nr:hypothetical protein GQ53DRAFT_208530 [Thozetella sp. PMI_491]